MNSKQTVLKVDGMSCHSCVSHINETLAGLAGVERVDVRMREGAVVVQHDMETIDVDAMVQALVEEGYGAAHAT